LIGVRPKITHRRAGIFGATEDRLPLAGRMPGRDGLWVAGGYSGHGNVLGLACGELVAGAILGRPTPELKLFDPARLLS
jgi:glycine/D-amino acid oxidase-like deaminating enzyme